jgi:2-oxoglutarate ferredoxin oxidoreductase subunit gamma
MVGFFAGASDVFPYDAVEKAVLDSVPKGTESLNLRALGKGYEFGRAKLA